MRRFRIILLTLLSSRIRADARAGIDSWCRREMGNQ